MGRWNRRYQPRPKYRHYDYSDPPLSPTNNHSYSSENRVPSWELDYCNSLKIPWKKVMASKKYIYCYPSVLHWDGSAAEEALQNAKERFWAMINGIPCDNPLPDPDLYIDEIDWNPQMDLELMAELDLPHFDPDIAQKDANLETIDEWDECAQTLYDKSKFTSDNPWERNNMQGAGSLKDASDNPWERDNTHGAGSLEDIRDNPWEKENMRGAASSKNQGWGRWEDDSVNLKNGNPWERNNTQGAGSLKDASDNPLKRNNTQGAGNLKDTSDNPLKRNNTQGAGSLEDIRDNPWESDNTQGAASSNNLQGWGGWGNDTVNLKNGNPWEESSNHRVDSLKDTAWRSGNESWGRSQWFDNTKSSPFIDKGCSNYRNYYEQTMAERQGRGRGRGHQVNDSWGWSQENTNAKGPMNLRNSGYSCENNYSTGFKERGWRDNTNEACGRKKAEFQGSESKHWDSQNFDQGGRSFRGDCRKRESSVQNTSKYKSSKYHRDTYRDSHQF